MGGKRGPKEIGRRDKEIEEAASAKPAGNVSLFDFLTDKLPANADQPAALTQSSTTAPSFASSTSTYNPKYESYARPIPKARSEPSYKPYFNSLNSSQNYQQDRRQDTTSSSVKSQEQNNSNRPKFENNLSSSFATRNSSHPHDDRYNRYSSSSRGGRGGSGNPFHEESPYKESSDRHRDQRNSVAYSSGRGGRASHESSSGTNYSGGRTGPSSGGYANRRYNDYQKEQQPPHRQEREQHQHQPQWNGYEQKAANGKGPSTSRYQQKENNSNNNNANPIANSSTASSNSNDQAARINKLVESTSKMKIDKTRSGPSPRNQQQNYTPQQNHQQQQQQQQQSKPHQHPPPTTHELDDNPKAPANVRTAAK